MSVIGLRFNRTDCLNRFLFYRRVRVVSHSTYVSSAAYLSTSSRAPTIPTSFAVHNAISRTLVRPTQHSLTEREQGENDNNTPSQRTMVTDWANEKRRSFVAVSENQEKVLIADSTRVNCVDLTASTSETPEILTLCLKRTCDVLHVQYREMTKRGLSTHYPAEGNQ